MNEMNRNDYREEEGLNFQDLVNKFLRRKNLFLYIAIPIFLGIIIAQFSKRYSPIYRATFDLGVSSEKPAEIFPTLQETPLTQIGTVTQRVISSLLSVNLAEKVVDTLGLYAYVKNGDSDMRVEVRIKKDFTKKIGPLKLHVSDFRFQIFKNGDILYEGILGRFVDCDYFEIKITPLKEIPGTKICELTIYPKNKMALALRNSLSIKVLEADKVEKEYGSSEVPFSGEKASKKLVTATSIFPGMNLIGILRINVHWGNPRDAGRIAQVLSDQIIRQDISEKSLQYIQSRTFIDSQLTLYQDKLGNLEEEIRLFKGKKKITDLRASTQALINQVSGLETKKNQLQIEQKILKDLNSYLAENIDTTPNFAATMLSDPILQRFYSQLLQTEAELKGKLKEYSNGHPKVLEIKAKLDGLKEQMKEEVSKRTSTIKTEIASVDNQISMLQVKLEKVPDDEIQLAGLERDRETAEKLYTFFAEKLEETRVQEAGVTSDLKIINPPLVSGSPVNARRPLLILALAFVISILAGGFAVFVAEYVDNTAKDPEIIKAKIGLPIFATIPVVDSQPTKKDVIARTPSSSKGTEQSHKGEGVLSSLPSFLKSLISSTRVPKPAGLTILTEDISSAEFEAFRKLSINLDFAHPEKKYRIIYVTSPGPEEGKTFVSLNLGVVLATSGKKSVIIDTDFRKKKGHVTDVTKLKKKEGLFDILKGETTFNDVIIPFPRSNDSMTQLPNEQMNLHLLPVGAIPPNPFIFLESDKMKGLLSELRSKYDYVIIDGVPVLLFADATYLANFADGVLITARYGKTGYKELEHTRDILMHSNSNIIGIVMNSVPRTRGSYYYHYYHKYYSKYYRKE